MMQRMIGTDIEIGGVIMLGLGLGTIWAAKHRTDKRDKTYEDEEGVDYSEADEYDDYYGDYRPQPEYDPYYTEPAIWQPREEEHFMPKVTDIPESLLKDGQPVLEGQILPIGDGKRQIKVIDPKPDKNGGILVQENYYVDAADIGCVVQPETVQMELSPDEARAILKFYDEALKRNTGQQPAVGDSTSQFARPVFEQIGKSLGRPAQQ
jgi:hypothetical protein